MNVENLVRELQYYEEYAHKLANVLYRILAEDSVKGALSKEAAELYAEFTGDGQQTS